MHMLTIVLTVVVVRVLIEVGRYALRKRWGH